jgi:UDP-glucuronate decarboxylase
MASIDGHPAPMIVTGGAGFLGSHLCESLLELNIPVLCVDNLVTGSLDNVAPLLKEPLFRFQRWDINEPLAALERARGICNLACPASPVHYQTDPIRTTMTSVRGAFNLLELARTFGIPMLQASTSEVYGDPAVHPQTEAYWGNVNPTGKRACYDEGKRCAESLCFDYRRQHGTDVRVARIFNTYGPRMQVGDGRVVSNFIVQALLNRPITIYGDGEQTRSFCYVDDLIRALVGFITAESAISGPINIGNPEEFTVAELAELVIELTGSRSRITFEPLPSDDPSQRCPDIHLARRMLAWEPHVALREGLKRTIVHFDEVLMRERTHRVRAAGLRRGNGLEVSDVRR